MLPDAAGDRKFAELHFFLKIGIAPFACATFYKSKMHPEVCEPVLDLRRPRVYLVPAGSVGRCIAIFFAKDMPIDLGLAQYEAGVAYCTRQYFIPSSESV